jgi:hypothetical protein
VQTSTVTPSPEQGEAWEEDMHLYRDPAGFDAAEILSSCDAIPTAMPLPSIQESGPALGETTESEHSHIVEVATQSSFRHGGLVDETMLSPS